MRLLPGAGRKRHWITAPNLLVFLIVSFIALRREVYDYDEEQDYERNGPSLCNAGRTITVP